MIITSSITLYTLGYSTQSAHSHHNGNSQNQANNFAKPSMSSYGPPSIMNGNYSFQPRSYDGKYAGNNNQNGMDSSGMSRKRDVNQMNGIGNEENLNKAASMSTPRQKRFRWDEGPVDGNKDVNSIVANYANQRLAEMTASSATHVPKPNNQYYGPPPTANVNTSPPKPHVAVNGVSLMQVNTSASGAAPLAAASAQTNASAAPPTSAQVVAQAQPTVQTAAANYDYNSLYYQQYANWQAYQNQQYVAAASWKST
jgi:hypothetical protein